MLDEKKINEIKSRIPSYIRDGIIKKDKVSFTEFLLNNAKNSLKRAKRFNVEIRRLIET